jgi:hypothetical protein
MKVVEIVPLGRARLFGTLVAKEASIRRSLTPFGNCRLLRPSASDLACCARHVPRTPKQSRPLRTIAALPKTRGVYRILIRARTPRISLPR